MYMHKVYVCYVGYVLCSPLVRRRRDLPVWRSSRRRRVELDGDRRAPPREVVEPRSAYRLSDDEWESRPRVVERGTATGRMDGNHFVGGGSGVGTQRGAPVHGNVRGGDMGFVHGMGPLASSSVERVDHRGVRTGEGKGVGKGKGMGKGKGKGGDTCHYCWAPGHYARECPMKWLAGVMSGKGAVGW